MVASSPCPLNPGTNPWRFTWETFAHIPTLRLYLFRSPFPTSLSDIAASLQPDRSLLFVSFSYEDADACRLEIPVPRVLIEPDEEIQCVLRSDHVEIKLSLVLPIDHPVVAQYRASMGFSKDENAVPISLKEDLKRLSSGDVDLYCKSCSNKLTKQPIRNIVQMPSLNWRDVTENWFGNCCCSFGAAAENLATQYLNSFNLSPEIGLLYSTSITISKDCLHGYPYNPAFQERPLDLLETSHRNSNTNSKPPVLVLCNGSHDVAHCPEKVADTSDKGNLIHTTSNSDANNGPNRFNAQNIYFGGGFVHYEVNMSKGIEWINFCCGTCSSPLGSYPCHKDMDNSGTIDGGVRLFKCYVSTSVPVSGPGDVFRYYTVQNLFSNILLENAEDEVSFRTVVRDLKSRKLVVQLVLLSSKAWYFSGTCIENQAADPNCRVELKAVAKVLFSDCSDASEDNVRLAENWSTKYHAEDFYMMTREIEELKSGLSFGNQSMPLSCSFMQGMHISFLSLHGF